MAVVALKRRDGRTTYRIRFRFGKQLIDELAGTDRREAERLEAQRKREVRAGTFRRDGLSNRSTVMTVGEDWMTRRSNRNAEFDCSNLRRHVFSRRWFTSKAMLQVRPLDISRLVDELRATISNKTGDALSEHFVINIYGLVKTMFRDAVLREIISTNPCILPPGTFNRRAGKKRAIYLLPEIRSLVFGEALEPQHRIFCAMLFLTGVREGEACGLRWSDWDPGPLPLGALTVERQYTGEPLKTDAIRKVPVHPVMAELLAQWKGSGFAEVHGHDPRPSDPILPNRFGRHQTRPGGYYLWRRACDIAGVENRSMHSTRHSYMTHARRGGARKDVLERTTHNASGDVVDTYTHWDWEPLCEAVTCLRLGEEPAVEPAADGVTRTVTVDPKGLENKFRRRDSKSDKSGENSSSSAENIPEIVANVLAALRADSAPKSPGNPKRDADSDASHVYAPPSPPLPGDIRLRRPTLTAPLDPRSVGNCGAHR